MSELESRIRRYVEAMDAGDVSTMLSLVADDILYLRPIGEGKHEAFRGRGALQELLTARFSAPRSVHHIETYAATPGDHATNCFVEGTLRVGNGDPQGWLASFRCTPDLLVQRWLVLVYDRNLAI